MSTKHAPAGIYIDVSEAASQQGQFDWTPKDEASIPYDEGETTWHEVVLPAPYSDAEIEERARKIIEIVDAKLDGDTEPPVPYTVYDPAHYRSHPSGVECIQVTEHLGFCIGNAIKYLWRAGLKEGTSAEDDLRKAIWYARRELARLGYEP